MGRAAEGLRPRGREKGGRSLSGCVWSTTWKVSEPKTCLTTSLEKVFLKAFPTSCMVAHHTHLCHHCLNHFTREWTPHKTS